MLSLEQIKTKLQDRKLYYIAQQIDVSYPTLKKLADGKEDNYTLDTIRKVSEYFENEKGLGHDNLEGNN